MTLVFLPYPQGSLSRGCSYQIPWETKVRPEVGIETVVHYQIAWVKILRLKYVIVL